MATLSLRFYPNDCPWALVDGRGFLIALFLAQSQAPGTGWVFCLEKKCRDSDLREPLASQPGPPRMTFL